MSLPPTKDELDAVHEAIVSPLCKPSYFNRLTVRMARALCERLQLQFASSGARGSIKEDYIFALKQYVRMRQISRGILINGHLQRQNKISEPGRVNGKRKTSEHHEIGESENTKRTKLTHSITAGTQSSTPPALGTAHLKRPAFPAGDEGADDPRVIKRMRVQDGPVIKLVRFKLPARKDARPRPPAHAILGGEVERDTSYKTVDFRSPAEEQVPAAPVIHGADTTTAIGPPKSLLPVPLPIRQPPAARPRKRGVHHDCAQVDTLGEVGVIFMYFVRSQI